MSIFNIESVRYFYEYCEWEQLTEVILNTYKNDISEFRTLNENELKEFQKEEDLKNFNNTARKMRSYIKNDTDNNENSVVIIKNNFYNDINEKNLALSRNIKRNIDFVIKLNDVKSNPLIIIISLFSNRTFKDSKMLILIILILLYIIMDLFQKQLLEPPLHPKSNYILNSVFFLHIINNIASNYFFYAFYRISCFKTIIYISLLFVSIFLLAYHFVTTDLEENPIDLNEYNFSMLSIYQRDKKPNISGILMFSIYFALNGVIFYVYLLILKISKTIYRCTFFSIHSISLIVAMVISECIHYQMDNFFLFISVLNLLCLLTFNFLSEFKELLYIIMDLFQKQLLEPPFFTMRDLYIHPKSNYINDKI